MLPKSIYPTSLWGEVFLKSFYSRFSEFPVIFSRLYRSFTDQAICENKIRDIFPKREASSVYLGAVTPDTPTIYSLLKEHPDYGEHASTILKAASNRHKAFTDIPTGSYVYLDTNTAEISWSMRRPPDE